MAAFSKSMVHAATHDNVKQLLSASNVQFKRLEISGVSREDKSVFYQLKDSKNEEMFWLVKFDERAGFSHGYINIIKKGNDASKKQEAMISAWKRARKALAARKKGAALIDAEMPENDNPFPLTAKLITIDKAPASNTVIGSMMIAVDNAFRTKMVDAVDNIETYKSDAEYNHQMEIPIPHKTVWDYLYQTPCPTGDAPDLSQILSADLKDAYVVLKLTGVNVKTVYEYGEVKSIAKACIKIHHIYTIPNLGAMKRAKQSPMAEIGNHADFASLISDGVDLDTLFESMISAPSTSGVKSKGDANKPKKPKVAKKPKAAKVDKVAEIVAPPHVDANDDDEFDEDHKQLVDALNNTLDEDDDEDEDSVLVDDPVLKARKRARS